MDFATDVSAGRCSNWPEYIRNISNRSQVYPAQSHLHEMIETTINGHGQPESPQNHERHDQQPFPSSRRFCG